MKRTALVMAGGTGGHIFPGLAVAEALRDRGWTVHWLGAPGGMEQQLVPPRGFAFEPVQFGGLRGKGPLTLPLMSFGGSAILVNLVALAVVLRVDYENKLLMRGGRV